MTAEDAIIDLLNARRPGGSICPSEAARCLALDGWRDRLDEVREAGTSLASRGRITVTQRGTTVDAATARGPIRYRLKAAR